MKTTTETVITTTRYYTADEIEAIILKTVPDRRAALRWEEDSCGGIRGAYITTTERKQSGEQ